MLKNLSYITIIYYSGFLNTISAFAIISKHFKIKRYETTNLHS